jgi:hypothetical protein
MEDVLEDQLEDQLEGLLADGILSGAASFLRTASASSAASNPTASRSIPAESRSTMGRATQTKSSIQSFEPDGKTLHDGTAAATEKSDQSPLRDGEPDGPRLARRLLLLKSPFRPSCGTKTFRPPRAIHCVSVTCQ